MSEKNYPVMFTAPGTNEHGTPKGAELIRAFLALSVEDDGYSYAAFGSVTRENLQRILNILDVKRPKIVCLCGSTRFMDAFQEANLRETIAGNIVLSVGCNTKGDTDLMAMGELTSEAKAALDELHKRKIDLADEILVLNVGGYIGESTRSEIDYAIEHDKTVRYLENAK